MAGVTDFDWPQQVPINRGNVNCQQENCLHDALHTVTPFYKVGILKY